MKIIKGNLVLKENTIFKEDIKVKGNIIGDYNLKVCGDIHCWNIDCMDIVCGDIDCLDIDCLDIDCGNIDCMNINCRNINCWNIDCENIVCWDINCEDVNFYAIAIAYYSFKCKSWKARRDNFIIKCLDGEVEIKDKIGGKTEHLKVQKR